MIFNDENREKTENFWHWDSFDPRNVQLEKWKAKHKKKFFIIPTDLARWTEKNYPQWES